MAKRPSRMIFDLSDDDRALLEAHRVRLGLRTYADTLRVLLRGHPRSPPPDVAREAAKTTAPPRAKAGKLKAPKRKPVGFTVTGEPIYR